MHLIAYDGEPRAVQRDVPVLDDGRTVHMMVPAHDRQIAWWELRPIEIVSSDPMQRVTLENIPPESELQIKRLPFDNHSIWSIWCPEHAGHSERFSFLKKHSAEECVQLCIWTESSPEPVKFPLCILTCRDFYDQFPPNGLQ